MGKQPNDGKQNITREQQQALKTEKEIADEEIVKEHGLPGLNIIAEQNEG